MIRLALIPRKLALYMLIHSCLLILGVNGAIGQGQSTYSEFNQLFLKQFSVKDGLSGTNVNVFHKDTHGYVWIGTDGGLSRFNGHSFVNYRFREDSNSISNDFIYDIVEDPAGTLWIGTANGLNAFNIDDESFTRYFFGSNNSISDVLYDVDSDLIWLAAYNEGIICFDTKLKKFVSVHFSGLPDSYTCISLVKIDQSRIVLGTRARGWFMLDLQARTAIPSGEIYKHWSSELMNIDNLLWDSNKLYAGTLGNGLIIYDLKTGNKNELSLKNGNFPSDLVESIEAGPDGKIFVATDGAGIIVLQDGEILTHHKKTNIYENDLPTNVVRTIHIEDERYVWVGTYNYGFGIHDLESSYLGQVIPIYSRDEIIEHNSTTCFTEYNDHILIGTDGSGVYKWNGDSFFCMSIGPDCNINRSLKVLDMLVDHDNNLWIGTYASGLFCIRENGTYKHFTSGNSNLPHNNVWSIKSDKRGYVWLATDNGLVRLFSNDKNEIEINKLSDDNVLLSVQMRALWIDSNDKLWIGTFNGGAMCFDISSGEPVAADFNDALPDYMTVSLLKDHKGNIWFGSYGQGLRVMDTSRNYVYKDLLNQLSNKFIKSLNEDRKGRIWAATNSGIYIIDVENDMISRLDSDNGLQANVFNLGATYMHEDLLLVGGINGFNQINASEYDFKQLNVPIVLERITKNGRVEECWNKVQNHKLDIDYQYASSGISFEYTALDFIDAGLIQFMCKLNGFDKDWKNLGGLRKVSYTNLPPGKYDFHVRAKYSWNYNFIERELASVKVTPAWWMTTAFKVCLVIIVTLLSVAIFQLRTRKLKQSRRELELMVSKKTKEVERQKRALERKNEEINRQNDELIEHNDKLTSLYKEVNAQKEITSVQRDQLEKAHQELIKVNNELEEIVKGRTEELKSTIQELNKTISELDRFVYSASHDLGAPLKSMLGLINIIKIENKDLDLQPHIQFLRDSVVKLEDVIQSLIQYSRNARSEVVVEEVNLKFLIIECLDAYKFMERYHAIDFSIDIADDLCVNVDTNRLKIILRNILSNAIKYSDPENSGSFIKINYQSTDHYWELSIHDNGVGINEDQLDKVYDMFYRATEQSDGSGLGLYIVRETLNKMNGDISIKSKFNEGTSVTVSFPIIHD